MVYLPGLPGAGRNKICTGFANYTNTLTMHHREYKKIWPALCEYTYRIPWALVVLIAGLAPPARAEWIVTSGLGAYWEQPAAVNATVNQFLGRPPGSGGGGAGDGGLGGQINANGPLDPRGHTALTLTWRKDVPLRPRLDLVGSVGLEYARTRWFVQDGIDVLRDDLSVDIRHLALTPRLSLRTALPVWRGFRTDLSAGVGADVIWTRTRISSALLDVRRSDRFSESFAFTRLGLGHALFPADRAVVDLEWRDSVDFSLRLGVEHRF